MKPFNLRPLLWFDCAAAAIAGTATLALAGLLATLFGLPRVVVVFIGLVNLAYGAFSFSLARQPSPARGRVRALVTANLLWVGVCVVMAIYFAGPGSWLGASYMLAEGFFVGLLATVEALTLKAVVWAKPK
ncbi:MAG TPA: hypothetical protein VI260_28765 [Blastocatellia bacterium]|jgi:hypothetical protein